MFNNLANYLLGYTSQEPAVTPREAERGNDVRLTAVVADDDWVLVEKERDSEGDTDLDSSMESIPMIEDSVRRPSPLSAPAILTRTSSSSSLPCSNIEESWFITPPPCFTSTGPVHMETSPLENLLIEHPSMSVYQHSSGTSLAVAVVAARRRNSLPDAPSPTPALTTAPTPTEDVLEVLIDRLEEATQVQNQHNHPRHGAIDTFRQQEKQSLKIKNAQKIHKTCQSLKRGYIERNNKAREVNCRNHHQRRGERSQGSVRSNANNNRKC